jgi:hypothetical protein
MSDPLIEFVTYTTHDDPTPCALLAADHPLEDGSDFLPVKWADYVYQLAASAEEAVKMHRQRCTEYENDPDAHPVG